MYFYPNNLLIMQRTFLYILFLFFSVTVSSQIININNAANTESSYSLQTLVEDVLITGTCSQITNFSEQVSGAPTNNQIKSYGYFSRPSGSSFPFEAGIVLSTGKAYEGGNTTDADLVSNDVALSGDADLESALGITDTQDATYIKFDFIPTTSTISFRFLMASEEYDGGTECQFFDGFAFLLRKVGTTNYVNLAVLPDSTPVSVFNINDANGCRSNEQYFEGYNLPDTNYGGRTKILTANANVIPNQVYEMKMVVADQGDHIWDSAIFLEAGSFNLGANLGDPNLTVENTAVCGIEKLLDSNIAAQSYKWFKDGNEISGATNQTYNANLGDGIYKVEVTLAANCIVEDDVELEFVTAATINNTVSNLYACDDDFDGTSNFDLTDKASEILDGQDPNEFEILYFIDNTYLTPVPDPTSIDSTGQTIYVTVQNIASTNCFAQSSFEIEVSTLHQTLDSTDIPNIAACDDTTVGNSYDGFNLFDLEERKDLILNGYSDTDYTLTYFIDDQYSNQIPNLDINSYINTAVVQTIYVQVTNNLDPDCFSRTSFKIEVYELPKINSPITFRQCDDDTDHITLMDLTLANSYVSNNFNNETFIYFANQIDAENGNMAQSIADPANYVSGNNTIWVRVENQHCFVVGQIDIDVTVSNIIYDTTLTVCDDFVSDTQDEYDGISEFDLTLVTEDVLDLFPAIDRPNLIITFYPSPIDNAQLQINRIETPNKFRNNNTNTLDTAERIYIRIDNKNNLDCAGMGLELFVDLIVEKTPYFEIENIDNLLYCTNWHGDKIPVRAIGYPKNYNYVWKDEFDNTLEISPIDDEFAYFTHAGSYTVIATDPDNNCTKAETFTVDESSLPRIKTLTIKDNSPNNQIAIIVEGEGIYEYALDDDDFVDGNEIDGHIFYNVEEGLHIVHIKDKDPNGCSPVLDKEVVIIRFPKYISPNHDGKHDKFLVYGGDGFMLSTVTIFDRYGRVLAILNQNEEWDGTYSGKIALEADYWFLAKFIDRQGKEYERRGNFSLKL